MFTLNLVEVLFQAIIMKKNNLYLFLAAIFCFTSCRNSEVEFVQSENPKNNIKAQINEERFLRVYRSPNNVNLFYLKINENFIYVDSSKNTEFSAPGNLIFSYPIQDSIVKIFLKINMHDTTFTINTIEIDSILLGEYGGDKEGEFYIKTNNDYGPWVVD